MSEFTARLKICLSLNYTLYARQSCCLKASESVFAEERKMKKKMKRFGLDPKPTEMGLIIVTLFKGQQLLIRAAVHHGIFLLLFLVEQKKLTNYYFH